MEKYLALFREKECPEDVLPMIGKSEQADRLRRVVLAWGKIRVTMADGGQIKDRDEYETWNALWSLAQYDATELKSVAGISGNIGPIMDVLIGHHIIYPDGSVSTFATKALRQHMKSQMNL